MLTTGRRRNHAVQHSDVVITFIQPTPIGRFVLAGVGLLVVLVAGLAMLALFMLWRNGYIRGWRAAREAPPACPKCGYNLSGLTHCRCPECGTEYKLDELWRIVQKESSRSTKGSEARTSVVTKRMSDRKGIE